MAWLNHRYTHHSLQAISARVYNINYYSSICPIIISLNWKVHRPQWSFKLFVNLTVKFKVENWITYAHKSQWSFKLRWNHSWSRSNPKSKFENYPHTQIAMEFNVSEKCCSCMIIMNFNMYWLCWSLKQWRVTSRNVTVAIVLPERA